MNKKLYISPEFEWLEVQLLEDVLTGSMLDYNKDQVEINPDEDDFFGDDFDEGVGSDGGGEGGEGTDLGDDW